MLTRRAFTWASLILLLLSGAWIAASALPPGTLAAGGVSAPRAGLLAPDFELRTLDGSSLRLSDLRGQPVIVNVWTSWCPPCKREMPAFQRVYQEYESHGLVILAVDAIQQDSLDDVRLFVSNNALTFPILLDERSEVLSTYQISAFPSTFFVDQEGVIRKVVIGAVSEPLLRSQVEEMLGGED
ncbi:MAG: redoxin domain-containing protein [Anaerolineaceae bacterium]|nr:redoxin domain-containing protein [Anaerolineaceae bacterium]